MGSATAHVQDDHDGGGKDAAPRQRVTRDKPAAVASPIEEANGKSDDEFVDDYLRPQPGWTSWTHPSTAAVYTLSLTQAGRLTVEEAGACFDLVDRTSGPDYRASSVGWHPVAKRREMASPELRYLLVRDVEGRLGGFASLMPTYEAGEPVVYCYEIHLEEDLQRTGLGKRLMQHVMSVAEHVPSVRKTMLTCFLRNVHGLAFYHRLGFAADPSSPGDRKLRGGKVVRPDYVILSRLTAGARRSGAGEIPVVELPADQGS